MLLGVIALAVNLRPAAVSVGPVLEEIRDGLGMSHLEAGILTSLPVVAFGIFGAAAPVAARKIGVHRLTLLALVVVWVALVAPNRPWLLTPGAFVRLPLEGIVVLLLAVVLAVVAFGAGYKVVVIPALFLLGACGFGLLTPFQIIVNIIYAGLHLLKKFHYVGMQH